ncbi:VanZ family protein [Methylomonas koyamae]|uniref:VanZ family protein n=1 Tax=Methylomonas koyamae TaxID=702114 RepID=UPI0007C8BAA7|nr:VanZ family protein [Methylomonas koyamae]ATG90843.1 hypothetical protein MKLM6_2627 [Methylomonas koyamae]WNB74151.1 VanZ family protein [Methylomonas koyamae]BBL58949.1 hypothetical protein MKFW12EY_25620 [Methylomonas koyamae]
MYKILDLSALLLYCALIFWLSDQAKLPDHSLIENQDKLDHFLAYFAMAVFAWRYFAHFSVPRHWQLLIGTVFCSLYGLSDEWHQSFVAGRESSALDWLADTLGGLCGGLACYWYTKRYAAQRSPG